MHLRDTPEYDQLIQRLISETAGGRHLDAQFWCAYHGHTFVGFDSINIQYVGADGIGRIASAADLMRYTTSEADAYAAVPSEWPMTVWRSQPPGWEKKRKAEARINMSRAVDTVYANRGANTVPLAICAALLALMRNMHRSKVPV